MGVNREGVRRVLALWGNTAAICKRRIEDLESFIELKEKAYDTLSSPKLDGMPKGIGVTGDPTGNAAASIDGIIESYEQAIRSIKKEIQEAVERKILIDALVRELSPEEQKILEYRYVMALSWDKIAGRTFYSTRQAQRIELQAIEHLADNITVEMQ